MSNYHEGVSCDMCMKSNFTGKRYKCLICYDYDLCNQCHEQSISSAASTASATTTSTTTSATTTSAAKQPQQISNTNKNSTSTHLSTHPMQCILTRSDCDMFYGGGLFQHGGSGSSAGVDYAELFSFTCPYCGKLGFSESTLCDHLAQQHNTSTPPPQGTQQPTEVVCPVCAALPSSHGGDPNHLTNDLLSHINNEHMNRNVAGANMLDFGSSSAAAAAAAALRFSRRLNYSQSSTRPSTSARNQTSIGQLGSANSGRPLFQFGGSGAGSGSSGILSSFMRSASGSNVGLDSGAAQTAVDNPIAELLSQLTGVRRVTSAVAAASQSTSSAQLQQLQAQLTRNQDNLQQQFILSSSSSSASRAHHHHPPPSSSSTSHHHHHHNHHNLFGINLGKALSSSKSHLGANVNGHHTVGMTPQQQQQQQQQHSLNLTNTLTQQILELAPNLFLQALPINMRDSKYLLSK
jgi:E3 ubiquitin-protein ligase KCMF1